MSHKVAVKVLGSITVLKDVTGAEEFISKLSYVVSAGDFSSSPLGFSHRAYHNMASSRTNDERETERRERQGERERERERRKEER